MCLATVLKATNLTTFTNFQDCESMSGAVWLHVHVSTSGTEWSWAYTSRLGNG